MGYRQLRKPDATVRDYAGSCLRMTRIIYGVGARWYTAWEAWDATKHYSRSRSLPNVSVPVWFDWTGYVPGHGRKRFGHVAAWIPGKGILSSPMSGHGQKWYPTIAALEADMSRATGSPVVFVGWSLDINGVLVAQKTTTKPPQNTPIIDDFDEDEDDMRPTIHFRTEGSQEWTRAHPDIGRDLKPGQSRKDGNVTVFRGFEVTANKTVGTAWARQYARGSGGETSRTNRAGYIAIQKQAQRFSVAVHG